MATVKISDGRTVLYQWDTGVIIELCDCRDFTECHFATDAGLIRREVTGSLCAVPDAALQRAGTLTVYAFARDENGGQTQHVLKVNVLARPRPADYINPPDEMDNLGQLAKRVVELVDHTAGVPLGPEYAGQLLFVGSDGYAAPLQIGAGLAIINGVLVVTNSKVVSAICDDFLCDEAICEE